jgi:coenzyme PQQ synthesis protein D (PqqD)
MMSKHHPSADVLAAHLEGEAVLLDLATKRYFRLNATSAAIWRGVEAGKSRDEIVDALLDGFDVDASVAAHAVDASIEDLSRRGLLRETTGDDDA